MVGVDFGEGAEGGWFVDEPIGAGGSFADEFPDVVYHAGGGDFAGEFYVVIF